jgi:hypothetical protein
MYDRNGQFNDPLKPVFLFSWFYSSCGLRPPHCGGLKIIIKNTKLGRTPLDEWSDHRWKLYLKTQKKRKRETTIMQMDSNQQSQEARGRRPTREAADPRVRPLGHWKLGPVYLQLSNSRHVFSQHLFFGQNHPVVPVNHQRYKSHRHNIRTLYVFSYVVFRLFHLTIIS